MPNDEWQQMIDFSSRAAGALAKFDLKCQGFLQEKEKLLTDLRTILHITNDQHFKFLEEVMGDKLVTRLRSSVANAEQNPNQAATNTMPPPPPRQQTPATANNTRNKPRPNSAGAKFPANNSPAQARSHRSYKVSFPSLSNRTVLRLGLHT